MKKRPLRSKAPERDDCLAMSRLCLSTTLRRTERIVTRHYDSYLSQAGVTAVQLPILAAVFAEKAPTFRLLGEQLQLERSTLSRNLSVLRRRGLLEIGPPSGPKPGLIALTARGRDALKRAHPLWKRAHETLIGTLDQEAVSSGVGFLKQLRRTARDASEARQNSRS